MLTGKVRYRVTTHPTWRYVNTSPVHIPMPGLPLRKWQTEGTLPRVYGSLVIGPGTVHGLSTPIKTITGTIAPTILTDDDSNIEVNMGPDGIFVYGPYAWDGASGPAIDTPSSIANSLPHDIGYQFIRMGLLPTTYKRVFDRYLYTCMSYCEEGSNPLYRTWRHLRGAGYLAAVHVGGWWGLRGEEEER